MITLINHLSNARKSVRVEVCPSIPPQAANPNENRNNDNNDDTEQQLVIDFRYKSYCEEDGEGGSETQLNDTLPLLLEEGLITWENIYDSSFVCYFEDYFNDLGVDDDARSLAEDAVMRGYMGIKETYGGRRDVGVVVMSVYVEVDDFDEDVQGHPMDVDEDYFNVGGDDEVEDEEEEEDVENNDEDDNGGDNNVDLEEVREFLIGCGVRFGTGLSSSSASACVICLEEMAVGSSSSGAVVALLPCNHAVHGDCLVGMVAKGCNSTCPVCRFKLECSR